MKILVVSAHPDDEVLGPGGTILKHSQAGDEVTILLACCGTNLRYGREAVSGMRQISEEVAGDLGATNLIIGELPDQGLDMMPLTEVARPIEEVIASHDPEMILTHHWGDINRDHRILCEAVTVAARPYAAPGVKAIHCFETPSSTEWGPPAGLAPFHPQRFVDIGPHLERKLTAFERYGSEVRPAPHPRSRPSLEARAKAWGSVVGMAAAEVFVVAREIL